MMNGVVACGDARRSVGIEQSMSRKVLRPGTAGRSFANETISMSRPRGGWIARPMCAVTSPPGSDPSVVSSATSGRRSFRWRTVFTGALASARHRNRRAPRLP